MFILFGAGVVDILLLTGNRYAVENFKNEERSLITNMGKRACYKYFVPKVTIVFKKYSSNTLP